jgi:hypothetical protein
VWAAAAVRLAASGFSADVEELSSWPECARLLSHALIATKHADALGVAAEPTMELLNRTDRYLMQRAQFAAAQASDERGLLAGGGDLRP